MDSYDYENALFKVLPSVAKEHKAKGGLMVLRPDSGNAVQCMLQAMEAGEKTFGANKNAKGYKVLNSVNAIQGDGINNKVIKEILDAILEAGFSAQNVCFGMGGGLLQKMNRDTMQFATKLSLVVMNDGTVREVMKKPKTDGGKKSLPGVLSVRRVDGLPTVFPRELEEKDDPDNLLRVVYDSRPVPGAFDDFITLRERVGREWVACPRTYNPLSAEIQAKTEAWIAHFNVEMERKAQLDAQSF
jgi:nicotinamide phosphoribosyltransferase